MNDGNMTNPRPLYGACVRTAEVICTTRTSYGQKRYHVAPRVYCLLSAAPLFDALFATLHAVLRLERRERAHMVEVPVPGPHPPKTTVSSLGRGGSSDSSPVAPVPTPWPDGLDPQTGGGTAPSTVIDFVHGNMLFQVRTKTKRLLDVLRQLPKEGRND